MTNVYITYKILPIELIFKKFANLTDISLTGLGVFKDESLAVNSKNSSLINEKYYIGVTSKDPKFDGCILGINENHSFLFTNVEEAKTFKDNLLSIVKTNYLPCEFVNKLDNNDV